MVAIGGGGGDGISWSGDGGGSGGGDGNSWSGDGICGGYWQSLMSHASLYLYLF